jgi:hypothetical protein
MNYNLCVKRVYQVIPATTKMQRSESVNMQKNKTKIANNSLYQPTNELELLEWSGGHKKKSYSDLRQSSVFSVSAHSFVDALDPERDPNGGIKYTNSQERYYHSIPVCTF